jgi:hypothetical protein
MFVEDINKTWIFCKTPKNVMVFGLLSFQIFQYQTVIFARQTGSLSKQYGTSSGCRWRNGLQIWNVAANILNKQSQTADKGWSSSLGVGQGANISSP